MNKLPTPAEIERQLRRIQSEVSPNEARTSLFNLVVYSLPQQAAVVEAGINGLLGKRPARVIRIVDAQPETRIDVSARCVEDWEGREVCIQEITISSGPDGSGQSPGTWIPLLIKEIPVHVWWLLPLGERADHLVSLLEDKSDRLLLDSRYDAEFVAFYRDFLKGGGPNRLPLDDVAWLNLHPVLKLTAQLFNPLDNRPLLSQISTVVLEGGSPSEAFFFFAWLRSKLGWKGSWAEFKGALSARDAKERPVSLLHQSPQPLSQGFTAAFKTHTGEELTVVARPDGTASLEVAGGQTFSAVYHHPDIAEALLRVVDRDVPDRLFYEVLHQIAL